jgi:hypothetical protein
LRFVTNGLGICVALFNKPAANRAAITTRLTRKISVARYTIFSIGASIPFSARGRFNKYTRLAIKTKIGKIVEKKYSTAESEFDAVIKLVIDGNIISFLR